MSTRQLTGRQRNYTFADHGTDDRTSRAGDYILKPDAKVENWWPSWDEPTTIRIYPALSPDDPTQFDPYRFSTAHATTQMRGTFGDWIRKYPVMKRAGTGRGVTFLLYNSADRSYNENNNPAWILYRALADLERANMLQTSWLPLMKGSTGKGAPLPAPSVVYVVQGAIMETGGKAYADVQKGSPPRGGAPEDLPVVFTMPKSAGERLVEVLNERSDGFRGDPDDFDNMYRYGDPVSLKYGRFVTIFQHGKDPRAGRRQPGPAQSTFGQSAVTHRDTRARSRNDDFKGYDCMIEKDWYGFPPQLDRPELEELVRSKWQPWEDILRFMTDAEQAAVLVRNFPPDVVMYAFRDQPEWLPDDVRSAAARRVSGAVPSGATPTNTATPVDSFGMPVGGGGPAPVRPSPWGSPRDDNGGSTSQSTGTTPGLFAPPGAGAVPPATGESAIPSSSPVAVAGDNDPDLAARGADARKKLAEARDRVAGAAKQLSQP